MILQNLKLANPFLIAFLSNDEGDESEDDGGGKMPARETAEEEEKPKLRRSPRLQQLAAEML